MPNQYANRYISMLYRYGQRFFAHKLKDCDIDVGQMPFLMQVCRNPGITQEGISANLGMDKGTTARGVRILEEAGYVARKTGTDKRVNHIYPTEKAQPLFEKMNQVILDYHSVLYKGLTQNEIEEVTRYLVRMKDNVKIFMEQENK